MATFRQQQATRAIPNCRRSSARPGLMFRPGLPRASRQRQLLDSYYEYHCLIITTVVLVLAVFSNGADGQVPTNIQAGATSPTTAFFYWTGVPNAPSAARYWYRRLNPSTSTWVSTTSLSVTLSNLESATPYRYQLQYCSNNGASCTATQNLVFRTSPASADPGFLDKSLPQVTNVTIVPHSNSISVSWRAPTNSASYGGYNGYMISWCAGTDCSRESSFRLVSTPSANITDLVDSTQYSVLVRTSSAPYHGPASQVSVRTTVGSMDPAGLPISSSSITIFWSPMPSSTNASLYWLRLQDSNWISTRQSNHVFSGLNPNSTYNVETQLCLNNASQCGDVTMVRVTTDVADVITTPPTPTPTPVPAIANLRVVTNTTHTLDIIWTGSSTCTSYAGSACDSTEACVSFTSSVTNHSITDLLDYTRYNVSVWCVISGSPGPQMMVIGNTSVSSDLDNLESTSDVQSITLSWTPKVRPLTTRGKVWALNPVSRRWQNTTGSNITLDNLTSATYYDIEIQYCADDWRNCGTSNYRRAKTLPDNGEGYDLDKSMANPGNLTVTEVSTGSVNLTWSPVTNALMYVIEVRRCTARSCPLEIGFSTLGTSTAINGLEDLNKYNITVRTLKQEDGIYYKSQGALIVATTQPAPLTRLQATSLSFSIELRWDAKSPNTNYEYQYRRDTSPSWLRTSSNVVLIFNDLDRGSNYTFQARFCGASPEQCSSISNVTVVY